VRVLLLLTTAHGLIWASEVTRRTPSITISSISIEHRGMHQMSQDTPACLDTRQVNQHAMELSAAAAAADTHDLSLSLLAHLNCQQLHQHCHLFADQLAALYLHPACVSLIAARLC
jgi:hypothetical protein